MCWARLEQAASRLRGQQLPTQSPAAGAPSGPRHEGAWPSILVTQGQCAARGLARSSERSGSCGVPRAGTGGSRPGPSLPVSARGSAEAVARHRSLRPPPPSAARPLPGFRPVTRLPRKEDLGFVLGELKRDRPLRRLAGGILLLGFAYSGTKATRPRLGRLPALVWPTTLASRTQPPATVPSHWKCPRGSVPDFPVVLRQGAEGEQVTQSGCRGGAGNSVRGP